METSSPKVKGPVSTPGTVIINGILLAVAGYWFYQVTNVVPEPYLVSKIIKVVSADVPAKLQCRMRSFMYDKLSNTGPVDGVSGIPRSPHPLGCRFPSSPPKAHVLTSSQICCLICMALAPEKPPYHLEPGYAAPQYQFRYGHFCSLLPLSPTATSHPPSRKCLERGPAQNSLFPS